MQPVPTVEELRAAVIDVMHGQRRHLERCAAEHGLSGQAAIGLLQLWGPWPGPGPEDDDGMPMRALAGRIGCDPSQVTGIADRLEDLGLVERRPGRTDRRIKRLVVTGEGERVAAALSTALNGEAPGFGALSDAERVTLAGLLRKVAAADGGSDDAGPDDAGPDDAGPDDAGPDDAMAAAPA